MNDAGSPVERVVTLPGQGRVAAEGVAEHGWDNVRLLAAPVAGVTIETTADAALFCAVHDVLQSPTALNHTFGHRLGTYLL